MTTQAISARPQAPEYISKRDPFDPAVITLTGYGLAVSVSRGHLVLGDGIGRQRRTRRLPRAQRKVRRIVILGQTGYVSLEAVQWCLDTGVALIQIDTLGNVLMDASSAGRDEPRLRRAQALAPYTGAAVEAACQLIVAKIAGQTEVLRRHSTLASYADPVARFIDLAENAETMRDISTAESAAAAGYFGAWIGNVGVRFGSKDAAHLPQHWQHFVARQSLIHVGPGARDAADPINALLNYAYALAEIECTIALRAVGLDPGLGVLHTDQHNRDSLALDIIEPLRPVVDDLILQLLDRRAFTRNDFVETLTGGCRLTPLLAAELTGHLADLSPVAGRYAELVARIFAKASPTPIEGTTPITGAKLRESRGGLVNAPEMMRSTAPKSCKKCGVPLASRSKATMCRDCYEKNRIELSAATIHAGHKRLAELREQGIDPRSTEASRARRAESQSKAQRANAAWRPTAEEEALTDEWYQTVLLPALSQVPFRQIRNALGVADSTAVRYRAGRLRPHKRHWLVLARLAGVEWQ